MKIQLLLAFFLFTEVASSQVSETLTDIRDGKVYKTVKIQGRTWLAQNLDVNQFRNGDIIPEAKTAAEWEFAGDNKKPVWCYYNNDRANGIKYGKLYNWYAVNDARGLAPIGTSVAADYEWSELIMYLGPEEEAGAKMKTTYGWNQKGNGTNTTGFSGLPGGFRDFDGAFKDLGNNCKLWSTESYKTEQALGRNLNFNNNTIDRYSYYRSVGLSVRCIVDENEFIP